MKFLVGLDGGGTKTLGYIIDESGTVLGKELEESSNIQAVGLEQTSRVLSSLAQKLAAQAGIDTKEIAHLYAGLAGAGRPADKEAIYGKAKEAGFAQAFTIDTDAAAALAGAFAGGPGIILISGTGAICFGKMADQRTIRCGGWGYLLGDEGSGYYMGQQAIIASLKDLDERGPVTALRKAIEQRYELKSIDLIISQVYSGKIDRAEIASLAPLVFAESQSGDYVAQEIIRQGGLELGKMVSAVARRMNLQLVSVALIGSIFKQKEILIPFMEKEVLQIAQECSFIEPMFEPAIGSAILAMQKENLAITKQVIANLQASMKKINL